MSITASEIVLKRIRELEEMITFLEPLRNNNTYNRDFYKHLNKNLQTNKELYAYLVGFAGENLLH
tara:strand:- start:239 stop:433 length:195 start_codon:yes stop_codon:yes gene_type:complete